MTQMGFVSGSNLKFIKDKMVLRIDGTISENDGLDWYESRIAHPDSAVEGLAHQIHSDASKQFKYFRNIAKLEVPVVISKSTCTSSLPSCDASSYPAPISMMVAQTSTKSPTTAGPAAVTVITSTGKIEIKMSKADATALATKPEAKAALAIAIAKTINVDASKVTILAIYVDGVMVGSRRLASDSTVRVDWQVKAAAAIESAAMDANTLKTNIQVEAKAVGVNVTITALPSVTVDEAAGTTAEPVSVSPATSNWCLVSFLAIFILLGW